MTAATTDRSENVVRKLPTAGDNAGREAREQADAYDSMFGTTDLELDDGTIIKIPPHPSYGMLDDDAADAYEQLLFEMDTTYDRAPDTEVPEQKLDNGMILPAHTERGNLLTPYRIDGKRVTPTHNIKIAKIALGDDYDLLRAGGRSAADVWKIWGKKSIEIQERAQLDSKSDGRDLDLETIPETDS
jgi:hypothetical protein